MALFNDEFIAGTAHPKASERKPPAFEPAYKRGLNPLNAEELLTKRFEQAEMVLSPWLPTKGLTMVYAPRGMGKTHVSIGVACAVAAGARFLRWHAPKARRVLFIDGEMPGYMLRSRFAATIQAIDQEFPPDNLQIVAADCEPDGLPDLADLESQAFFERVVGPADLVIVDNLSTICRSLKENEADSWGPVQAWALSLRRQGKSVLFIHHSGKSGAQRGTSRKEDVLNSVIALRKPPDYGPEQGARFEVHYEKARGFYGPEAEPFVAALSNGSWEISDISSGDDIGTMQSLKKQGLSDRDIAERTGRSKSTVNRMLREGQS
jgi:hypothetical protein